MQDGIRLLCRKCRLHLQVLPQFLAGCEELVETEWFEQIVNGIYTESLDGIFRICGREYHGRRVREGLDEIHARKIRHVDVEEHGVGCIQMRSCRRGAAACGYERQERDLRDVHFELPQRKRLVVYGYDSDHDNGLSGCEGISIMTS